jgi:FemAB family
MVYGIKNTFWDKNLSFWQTESWKTLLQKTGYAKEVFYYGKEGGTCILVEIRSLGWGFFGAFSLGVKPSQIKEDFPEFQKSLQDFLWEKGVLFWQIEPLETIDVLQKVGEWAYKKFLTPYTRVLDITHNEETLLAAMHEKWRYNIRLATKRWVSIEAVEPSEENIRIWMELVTETTTRDGFHGNSQDYYEAFLGLPEVKLYFAFFEWRVIAGGIFVFRPDMAIYYYGVSSSLLEDRKQMAPYLLQWHAITEAKKQGIPLYDFLWVSDPNVSSDSLSWVSQFKEKFWGSVIKLPAKHIFFVSLFGRIMFFMKKFQEKIFR